MGRENLENYFLQGNLAKHLGYIVIIIGIATLQGYGQTLGHVAKHFYNLLAILYMVIQVREL